MVTYLLVAVVLISVSWMRSAPRSKQQADLGMIAPRQAAGTFTSPAAETKASGKNAGGLVIAASGIFSDRARRRHA